MTKDTFACHSDFLSLSVHFFYILKNTENEIFSSLGALIEVPNQNITVVTHENPDGDAIGSAIGWGEILKNMGHNVIIIVPNDYPAFLNWFSSDIEIINYERKNSRTRNILKESDILFCLDFNEPKRTSRLHKFVESFSNPKVLIDHHPYPSDFCDIMISEPEYSSTCELVFEVIHRLGLEKHMNVNAAEALFTGIMTDTGSFSHNISRPATFRAVAKLIEYGIDTEKIHSAVYDNFSANRMRLLGNSLSEKMKVFPEYRSAVIWLSLEDLDKHDFQPGDSEGFVNYPLSINNIVFSALFMERKDHVKASFRSKGSFACNVFSRDHFSGGGHLNAAGGETNLSLEEAVEKFTQLLSDYESQLLETKI